MRFNLKSKEGFIPVLKYGERGRELTCFVPENYHWEQLNYGQGEGQVEINNCECGFYYASDESISVILHQGVIELSEALNFIQAVKLKIFADDSDSITVRLVGCD